MQKFIFFLVAVGGLTQMTHATRFSPSFYLVDIDFEIQKLAVLLENVNGLSDDAVAKLFDEIEWLNGFKSGRDTLCIQIKIRIAAMKDRGRKFTPISPVSSRCPTPEFPSCG